MEGLYFKNLPKFVTPEEELKYLREHIIRREAELKSENLEIKKEEVANETVKAYKLLDQKDVLSPISPISESHLDSIVLRLRPENHDSKMEELLAILLEKGIKNALSVVSSFKNPHLDDDFHRFLVQYLISHGEVPGLKPEMPVFKPLHMKLFEITLPSSGTQDENSKEKKYATLMEQFLYGMQSIASDYENKGKDYYTIEISLSNQNDHIGFYSAVPEKSAPLFEKQLLALYPNASIKEVSDDYNIFSDGGGYAGTEALLSSDELFPIRTYEKIDHDSLEVIMSAFSKLKKEGEGAAIQFVISPAGDKFINRFTKILQSVKSGMDLKRAKSEWEGVRETFGRATKDLIFGIKSKDTKKEGEENKADDEVVGKISEKVKATIMSVGIRIAAGAETNERAEAILSEIKSAFNQFDEAGSNSIRFNDIDRKNIESFLHNFSYRIVEDNKSIPLNMKEIATIVHFPLVSKSQPQLKSAKAGTGPAPLEMGHEGVLLGYNEYRSEKTDIRMSREDRLRHLYVVGQTGTGKTSILKNLIAQDIANGDGCCYIDPHGTDIQDILSYIPPERINDVIYFDPSYAPRPMALNMLEYDPNYPEQKTFVVNEMMNIFNQLFDMKVGGGAMFEQYFKNAAFLVMEHPESGSTLLEVTRVLADKEFRDMKLSYCKNPIIKQFWISAEKTTGEQGLQNFVPYISSKFDPLISNDIMRPVIAQQNSSFDFRKIMDEKKILLVNLSKGRLGEINSNLIGLILVGKLQMAALSRVDMYGQKINDFYLYIDEFQNITTPSISSILSEARKYKLSLNIAHQYIAQLSDNIKNAIFGNVGSMAIFRVSPDDAKVLEMKLEPTFSASDILKLENRNAYMSMIINGAPSSRPFNIVTANNPEGNKEIISKIKELSYLKYGRDREEVESEIMQKFEKK